MCTQNTESFSVYCEPFETGLCFANNPDIYMRARFHKMFSMLSTILLETIYLFMFVVVVTRCCRCYFPFFISCLFNSFYSLCVHYAQLCLQVSVIVYEHTFSLCHITKMGSCVIGFLWFFAQMQRKSTSRLINSLTRPIVIAFAISLSFNTFQFFLHIWSAQ